MSIESGGQKPVAETGTRAPKTSRFIPSRWMAGYWLPARVLDTLTQRLTPFRNRLAAHQLARYLGWNHSGSKRLGKPFPILRELLKTDPDLKLSEDQIRGAIKTLLEVEFITREPTNGSKFERTPRSPTGVRRKMHRFHFGPEFAAAFAYMIRKSPTRRGKQGPIQKKEEKKPCLPRRVGEIAPPKPIRCKPTPETRVPGFDEHLGSLLRGLRVSLRSPGRDRRLGEDPVHDPAEPRSPDG